MTFTVFRGFTQAAHGSHAQVLAFMKDAPQGGEFLVFDDTSGRQIDLDLRAAPSGAAATAADPAPGPTPTPTRGRPRLGVVPREVTLLPRHWDWLASQPGGASATLRRLIDHARRANAPRDQIRQSQESAYRFLSALAGNLPGFEEATRALFSNDRPRFEQHTAPWPADVRRYALQLAFEPQPAEE